MMPQLNETASTQTRQDITSLIAADADIRLMRGDVYIYGWLTVHLGRSRDC
jgi:hypothetical protein